MWKMVSYSPPKMGCKGGFTTHEYRLGPSTVSFGLPATTHNKPEKHRDEVQDVRLKKNRIKPAFISSDCLT